jgi:Ca2+:H+ antiporter
MEHPVGLVVLLAAICGVLLITAISIVRHADVVAHRLGEPLGTLLLTLAVTGLEVAMVGFVMSTGDEKPTLARDTMLAVVMLVLNGFMGLSLLLGGLRHREQPFNLQSSHSFLVMTIPLVIGISLATGRTLVLGIDSVDTVMLLLTLVTSIVTFSQPRTNLLLGCVHLLLFLAYMMLMFER